MPSRKAGCIQCRKRHVRCDSVRPACGTCREARDGRRCSYISLDIRPARYIQQRIGRQTLSSTAVRAVISPSPDQACAQAVESGAQRSESEESANVCSPTVVVPNVCDVARPDQAAKRRSALSGSVCGRRVVTEPEEAELFDYYIKEVGYYLDIVSPDHHLSRAAPILALTDPLLYSACLAYASHVQHLLGRLDKAAQQRYNENAIKLLIHRLSKDPSTWSEGSVLTTTVLLRVTEQFSEIAEDGEYHLNGAFSITASAGRTWSLEPVDLETSAFWTYLRMSVRMCFLCEHATKGDPVALVRIPSISPHRDGGAMAEAALTNRMTYLMARICNACWPPSRDVDRTELLSLQADLQSLEDSLPQTFEPCSSVALVNGPYQRIRYISSWHAIFWQFFYAAQVLLATNFALLGPAPSVASQGQYLERKIVAPTRMLLAVAFSGDEIGLRINAAALVGWCSQFLTKREEQDAVTAWLARLSVNAAWPSETVLCRLKRIWAGEQSHWTADPIV